MLSNLQMINLAKVENGELHVFGVIFVIGVIYIAGGTHTFGFLY